jgi:hypothetical protein
MILNQFGLSQLEKYRIYSLIQQASQAAAATPRCNLIQLLTLAANSGVGFS